MVCYGVVWHGYVGMAFRESDYRRVVVTGQSKMQVVRSHVPKSGVSGWRREGSSAGVRESTGSGLGGL